MKKHGLLLLLAALLLVAPAASAADFSSFGLLDGWISRFVAFFSGEELGDIYPPSGFGSPGGDPSELGDIYPPGG